MNLNTILSIIIFSLIVGCVAVYAPSTIRKPNRKPNRKPKKKLTKREVYTLEKLEKYMKKHKLLRKGWKYEISKRITKSGGYTIYHKKTIRMGYKYIQRATKKELKDSILHEIAHALVGYKVQSHGKIWKTKAISIGCSGNRCHYTNMS